MSFRAFFRRWIIRFAWGFTGVVITGLYLYYLQSQSQPDLQFWHREDVAQSVVPELSISRETGLPEYLEHEEKIFSRLDELVADAGKGLPSWHRYSEVGNARYRAAKPNTNRTQLLTPDKKRGAVLLVHGLSDSPHSMHSISKALYEQGYQTLNLRMPGHGTLPGALQNTTWREFRSAYRLGIESLTKNLAPGQPLILVGYSNGSTLAVNYTLNALTSDGEHRVPELLVLISPAMKVSPVAAYARIQRWISELPGLEKLGWTDVVAEFDPFKYNSFPVYAGEQIYRLTAKLDKDLSRLERKHLQKFPPVIAFQSVLDSTIEPASVVHGLLDRLAGTPAELVLFDINRQTNMLPLLADRGEPLLDFLTSRQANGFDLTIVTNEDIDSGHVAAKTLPHGDSQWQQEMTELRWPRNVYSLSHVALPFNASDPIYGIDKADGLMRLGELWFKGERGGLGVPLGLLARQRFNPFFPYLEERVIEAVDAVTPAKPAAP
ncbi:MAG: alpha/beta fold hydrolase [Halioglobus sp.]